MQSEVNEERLELVVLAWLWCQTGKPATAASLATAMKPMVPQGAAQSLAPTALERLVTSARAERIQPARKTAKASFKITESGQAYVSRRLGRTSLPVSTRPFGSISTYELPAIASGLPLPQTDKKSQKTFTALLPLAVCIQQLDLPVPLDRGLDVAKLELVKLALSRMSHVPTDRIYLKKLTDGVLPALVVGPLLGEPETKAAKLDQLLAAVVCKILDHCQAKQIKFAVVKRWLGVRAPTPSAPPLDPAGLGAHADSYADPATFSRQALAAAQAVAHVGGAGVSNLGDKVLVHYAWRQYERTYGPLPLERFKQNLSEVNGTQLVLVREDLIPEDRAQDFSDSEVRTGASRFHYIRVSNTGGSHG